VQNCAAVEEQRNNAVNKKWNNCDSM